MEAEARARVELTKAKKKLESDIGVSKRSYSDLEIASINSALKKID